MNSDDYCHFYLICLFALLDQDSDICMNVQWRLWVLVPESSETWTKGIFCHYFGLFCCFWSGLTCQHVSKAVDLSSVKKSVLSSIWLMCSDCLKERTMIDGEPAASHDILVCLKCGFQVRSVFNLFRVCWKCKRFHYSNNWDIKWLPKIIEQIKVQWVCCDCFFFLYYYFFLTMHLELHHMHSL